MWQQGDPTKGHLPTRGSALKRTPLSRLRLLAPTGPAARFGSQDSAARELLAAARPALVR